MKLGETQRSILNSMLRHGGCWHPKCGWYWASEHSTQKSMDAMLKKGVLAQEPYETEYYSFARYGFHKYTLTTEGLKALEVANAADTQR